MHVGIFGPTRCGKTTLAQLLAHCYLRAGRANLVCDPLGATWPAAAWTTNSCVALLVKAKASKRCILWIEETSIAVKANTEFDWFFTTAGNPLGGGHITHVIGQIGRSLLPGQRQQLSKVYLFRCHPKLAAMWAEQFSRPEIEEIAPRLDRYQFIVAQSFGEIKPLSLKL